MSAADGSLLAVDLYLAWMRRLKEYEAHKDGCGFVGCMFTQQSFLRRRGDRVGGRAEDLGLCGGSSSATKGGHITGLPGLLHKRTDGDTACISPRDTRSTM